MRPTRTIPVPALLLLAVVLAAVPHLSARTARAGEAEPPRRAKKAADDEARVAGEIGRALLSPKAEVRRAAAARLLQRIAQGGDLATFLDAMGRAQQAWADRHERLMEVWLHDAVHGGAAERERAVRLLTALGERAIRRLALELRHARLHEGAKRDASRPPPAPQEAAAAEPDAQAPGTPRVYDLRDLFQRGMNPVQLRGLLQKAADAVEVKQFKTLFVVTAMDRGHEQLRDKLNALRVRYSAEAPKPTAPQSAVPAPTKADAPEADVPDGSRGRAGGDTPPPAPAPADAPDAAAAPAPAEPARAKTKAARGTWRVEAALFHLPRSGLDALDSIEDHSQLRRALPRPLLAGTRDVVRTEDFARASDWTRALRRYPDARTGLPLQGATRVDTGGRVGLFAGKQIQYSKSVRRTKGGAWRIVTGTIPHGIALELAVRADGATALRVDLVATRTEVGLPIPVVRFQPSAQSAPVELERPEWSTTRLRRSFDLPPSGGAALVSLQGLGSAQDDHLVLALTLRQPAAK